MVMPRHLPVRSCASPHGRLGSTSTPVHLEFVVRRRLGAGRWTANLRILEIDEINTVSNAPLSHPFVERLIGTMRREFLDQVLFWNACDLERKLADFQAYYNGARCHASLEGHTDDLCQWTRSAPSRSAQRALGLSLQGPRPA